MQCKIKAKPKPEFVWYKGKARVTESSRVVIRTVEVDSETFEYYLEVKVRKIILIFACYLKNVNIINNLRLDTFCRTLAVMTLVLTNATWRINMES